MRLSLGVSSEAKTLQQLALKLDDRIQCELCGRHFNEAASEKHIVLCADKAKRDLILRKKNTNVAMARMKPPISDIRNNDKSRQSSKISVHRNMGQSKSSNNLPGKGSYSSSRYGNRSKIPLAL